MTYQERYQEWINAEQVDSNTKFELLEIKDHEKEIEDRFYKDLTFGTGGLRGEIGVGSNRMNVYTVRRTTQGLASYLNSHQIEGKTGVAIAYDSRHFSATFAKEVARTLVANNINVYLFDGLRPTPELSYAVRKLNCVAGVCITASHNPAEYNGYKVYGSDGGQITLDMAQGIIETIDAINIFTDVKLMVDEEAMKKPLLKQIGKEIDEMYLDDIMGLSLNKKVSKKIQDFKIVYTPLHGSGYKLVTGILRKLGYKDVVVVEAQKTPDGAFPTVKSPNPEEKETFTMAIQLATEINGDIIIGTDPDSDRVGVVVRSKDGSYKILTGNQIGALLTHYIVSNKRKITQKDTIIKTIVTSDLGANIAKAYGASVVNTLTGFKFIGEKIKDFETDKHHKFLFGYEESYGYLAGTFVRDKDAVIASALIIEMAAWYKLKGETLLDGIDDIYKVYGYYKDDLESFVFKGIKGVEKIKSSVEKFRDFSQIKGRFKGVVYLEDYEALKRNYVDNRSVDISELPQSNVIKIHFEDESWLAIRPSGTEPKFKVYYSAVGTSELEASERLLYLKETVASYLG